MTLNALIYTNLARTPQDQAKAATEELARLGALSEEAIKIRKRAIAKLVASGWSVRSIANHLGISRWVAYRLVQEAKAK